MGECAESGDKKREKSVGQICVEGSVLVNRLDQCSNIYYMVCLSSEYTCGKDK